MNIKKTIDDVILEVLGDKITKNDIKPEALLTDNLGADSIQLLEIALTISSEFGINVPKEDVIDLKSVQDVYTFVASKKGVKL